MRVRCELQQFGVNPVQLTRGAIELRAWREGQGLTRGGAAKKFATDRDTYRRWEEGATPRLHHLVRIEEVSGIGIRSWTYPHLSTVAEMERSDPPTET